MFRSNTGARRWGRVGALVASTALVATGLVGLATPAFAAATGGVGATLPYVEVQAENSVTNGTVIGPNSDYGTLPDEASYRKAVTLSGTGKFVTFTTPVATNSIDFRYSIPDTSGGSVYTAPISLYISGVKQPDFTLTNAYSWYYSSYPFSNQPGSNPHHFYDEVHRLFSTTYQAGTTFTIQVDSEDTAASYTIDFADFENVAAALPQPAGSISVVSKGADATGSADSTAAFNAAISAAGAGGTVWIPPGTYNIPAHIIVNNVTVAGAGMWYSTITGAYPGFYGPYVTGGSGMTPPGPSGPASQNVHLSDFAIFGNVQERNDGNQYNGIGGALSNSTVTRLWIEHEKVGAWMDGPMDGLVFSGMRIRNTTADGINFHDGVTNSQVTNSDLRNLGDDGLATWADTNPDANDSFDHDTVQYPILANGIAIYGGHDNFVTDNRVIDAGLTQGGGIHVAQRFASTTLGRTDVLRNTLIRDGSLDPNWQFGTGALWFDARDGVMNGLTNVDNILIQQSPYAAIMFVSGSGINNVKINNATIQNTGTWGIQEMVGGALTLSNTTATGIQAPTAVYNCGVSFTITDGGGNSGILSPVGCTNSFVPTFPPYLPDNGSLISISPTALGFGSVATGASSATQAVTVTNSGTAAAPVTSIATTGDFSQTNTCGTSIAAGGSCAVNVKFTPTAAGSRTGNLTITASGVTSTVPLSGTGVAPGPILSASPASLAFASTIVGNSSATQTSTVSNTGTTAATISSIVASGDFSQTNTCGASLAVGASCVITAKFTPTTGGARTGAVTITSSANNSPTAITLSGNGIGTNTNIAQGQPASASSSTNSAQLPANATDGDTSTYWESVNGAFPQWLQVDLGTTYSIGKVTLTLPPLASWATRTQTLSVQTSTDGTNFATTVASATYTFTSPTNVVNITLPTTNARYVRVNITANSGWAAGQVSELQVYPAGGTPPPNQATLSAAPSSLTFASQTVSTTSAAQTVTVTNTGTAAATVSSVTTTGDFSQTNTCGTSIATGASCTLTVKFTPTATGTRTGSVTVNSNATNPALTVALTGTGAAAGTATLSASPASLTFGSTNVGSASAAQSVTITNTGSVAATVSGVSVTGDYTQTNGCGSLAAGATCSVSVVFHPTATGTRTGTLTVASNASNPSLTVALSGTGAGTTATNLAAGKATSESSHNDVYPSSNVTDGNQATYWESANNAFPQWVQVDLGSSQSVSKVVLQLPTGWGSRTETLTVQGSTNGTTFTNIVGSATYTFTPGGSTNNTVTITFTATTQRYFRLSFTANSGWPAGQLSEFQVWNI